MPASADAPAPARDPPPGQSTAVLAESLYLVNLLVLPAIGFLALSWLFLRSGSQTPALARSHISQSFSASLWGGTLLVFVILLILALGGYQAVNTWTLVILYFTTVHATFVLIGIIGLAKAMAGRCWRIPLIGPPLPSNCRT
jgi:hypothetical protein